MFTWTRRAVLALIVVAAPAAQWAAAGDACDPCCKKPCIAYRTRLLGCDLCCCDPCQPPVKVVLKPVDPCTCCAVEVCVCVPACCTGEPCVECGRGLFGRSTVTYTWDCGYSVTVKFKRNGDVIVVSDRT